MSLRYSLLILIGIAIIGTCAVLDCMNSQSAEVVWDESTDVEFDLNRVSEPDPVNEPERLADSDLPHNLEAIATLPSLTNKSADVSIEPLAPESTEPTVTDRYPLEAASDPISIPANSAFSIRIPVANQPRSTVPEIAQNFAVNDHSRPATRNSQPASGSSQTLSANSQLATRNPQRFEASLSGDLANFNSDRSDTTQLVNVETAFASPTPNPQSPAPNLHPSSFTPHPSAPPNSQLPAVLQNADAYVLAAQPKLGDHWKNETPTVDHRAAVIEPFTGDFSPGPAYDCFDYDPFQQQHIYEGKTLNANQRPFVELGRPWYQLGQLSPGSTILGQHNPVSPQFLIFGDIRSGFASNTQNGDSSTLSAFQANLNFDLQITSTERFHMFMSPATKGVNSTGYLYDEERFLNNMNANVLFGYFEGDLGAITGGLTNRTLPFDLPFVVGVMPMIFQNGIWMESQILGFAFTIPARSSARFDISNMDITFFAGYDKLATDAFPGDDSAGKVYGIATFMDALNGYIEADYAFVEDRTFLDRSYHNLGIGYTRRYGRFLSNSTRMIVNLGQNPDCGCQTADGVLLLSENSLITGAPSTVVPYFNLFAGFDRPQSVARNALAGGILRNTGILFESDNLTGYPTLDSTANDTFGGALGLNLLANDFSQQLVLETAFLSAMGDSLNRNAPGDQYGVGIRYQLPLSNALIFRADAMYGFLRNTDDIHGVRMELRHKF